MPNETNKLPFLSNAIMRGPLKYSAPAPSNFAKIVASKPAGNVRLSLAGGSAAPAALAQPTPGILQRPIVKRVLNFESSFESNASNI